MHLGERKGSEKEGMKREEGVAVTVHELIGRMSVAARDRNTDRVQVRMTCFTSVSELGIADMIPHNLSLTLSP